MCFGNFEVTLNRVDLTLLLSHGLKVRLIAVAQNIRQPQIVIDFSLRLSL
jgi:hypothetical protein